MKAAIIEGMWEGEGDFCAESGLDGMNLLIKRNKSGSLKACLIMYAENAVTVNETFDISFGVMIPRILHHTSVWIGMDNGIMPQSMNANLDLSTVHMTWFDSEQECARFVRKF